MGIYLDGGPRTLGVPCRRINQHTCDDPAQRLEDQQRPSAGYHLDTYARHRSPLGAGYGNLPFLCSDLGAEPTQRPAGITASSAELSAGNNTGFSWPWPSRFVPSNCRHYPTLCRRPIGGGPPDIGFFLHSFTPGNRGDASHLAAVLPQHRSVDGAAADTRRASRYRAAYFPAAQRDYPADRNFVHPLRRRRFMDRWGADGHFVFRDAGHLGFDGLVHPRLLAEWASGIMQPC
jgi:hypothetical protein